jgi:hypothetical protein
MKCTSLIEPIMKGGMMYVKKNRLNSCLDKSNRLTGFCKGDQPKGCWNYPLDFHHYWSSDRPSPADPRNHSFLLFYRNFIWHGLQAEKNDGGATSWGEREGFNSWI